jgi:hypothetical protein
MDDVGLKIPGDYCITCECSKVYIDQSGCTVEKRVDEHQRHIRHSHPEKSAVAEHSINIDHKIRFQETKILATATVTDTTETLLSSETSVPS